MTRHNTPESRPRQPSHPIIDSRDEAHPEDLTEAEREPIYRELHEHEVRIDTLEKWKVEMTNANSIPATLNAPGGFSVTGNWRLIAGICVLAAIVGILYIVVRYG